MAGYDFFALVEERSPEEVEAMTAGMEGHYQAILLRYALDCRRVEEREKQKAEEREKTRREGLRTQRAPMMLMRKLGLIGAGEGAVARLPLGSAILEFDLVLEKNYVSRDDAPFYPTDNPVRKERVFRAPMVAGSSWKGSLRSAAVENLVERREEPERKAAERIALVQIFGEEKGEEEGTHTLPRYLDDRLERKAKGTFFVRLRELFGDIPVEEMHRKGRVRCLPTYFGQIQLDVLNPRERKTRAGTLPIVMEVVPADSVAQFSMLYVPFDLLGRREEELRKAVQQDWKLLGEALVRMLRYSGFGAKKSSGCGKAKIRNLRFESRLARAQAPAKEPPIEELLELHSRLEAAP